MIVYQHNSLSGHGTIVPKNGRDQQAKLGPAQRSQPAPDRLAGTEGVIESGLMALPSDTSLTVLDTDQQLITLCDAALSIASDLSLSDTLKRIVVSAAELVGARYAALGVPDESGGFLAEFVTTGLTEEQVARIGHRPRGHGLLGVILHEGKSLRLRNLNLHPRSVGFPPNHPPMTSFLGVPVAFKGERVGDLYLANKRGAEEFTAKDQRLVELLAAHAGIAIENARLYTRVQRLSVVEERQRIGMDLHDGVIQSIYAVGLTLEYVQAQLEDGELTGASERLRGAVEGLNAAIRDIRSYILDLRPRRFDGEDLVVGLERLLAEFKANTLMTVSFHADPEADQRLGPEARLALFHIAQEALSNAARHSRASQVEVRLDGSGRGVTLSLRDNGRGFNVAHAERRVGHGLMNMRDRATALGGELAIERLRSGGTEVRVTLPAQSPAGSD
jgi:signal transduction histidine kinase